MRKSRQTGLAAILCLLTFFAVAGTAMATPSTQIWIPSTDTQPGGSVHLGVDNYTTLFKKADEGGHMAPTDIGLTVGLIDTSFIGVEVGGDLREQSDFPLYVNAKLQVKEDSVAEFFPSIALGVYDFGTEDAVTNYNMAYVLMAKTFPVFGRLSLGYYVGNADLLKDGAGNNDNDGFLASVDRTMAEIDDRLWVSIDYMEGSNVYGALSFGVSWRFAPQVSGLLGYVMYNDNEVAGEDQITIQFDIDF